MQIIESTVFGLRSAVIQLEAGNDAPRFDLFPMVHVADSAFYEEIAQRLDNCDLVLCEGVKSPTVSLLTSSYRFCEKNPRLGLVTQKKALKLDHLEGRLIHADVSAELFEKRWSTLATLLRVIVLLAAPIYGLYLRYFGTREDIARGLGMNLKKSRGEILADEDFEKVTEIILDWRDRRLLKVIDQTLLKNEDADISIGILFGAMHMRAVIRHLIHNLGYHVTKAEWVTVFTL